MTESSNARKVLEFHEKFGVPIRPYPGYIDQEREILRIRLIAEEFSEFITAVSMKSLVDIADALGDLLYVVYGAGWEHGIDLEPVLAEIHNSNMTKTPNTDHGLKILKGPDYIPPDLATVLDRQIRERFKKEGGKW